MANVTNALNNNTAGFNQLTAEQAEYYQKVMLKRLTPELFFAKYGVKKPIPKRAGDLTSFRRLNSLNVDTTALTEGVTPDNVALNITKITAQVKQYGRWVQGTDWIDLTALDPIVQETSELLGENAGETIDTVIRDIVAAGTNVVYANSKTARNTIAATDKITRKDMLRVRRTLKRAKAKPISVAGYGKGYLAFIHTDVATDLMQDPDWIKLNVDGSNGGKNMEDGVLGKMDGIIYMEADNAPKFAGDGATGADVYGVLVIGDSAYGIPEIDGSSKPDIIVKGVGSGGTNDPLDQKWTAAWKSAFIAVRLNELCIVRFECGASA